MLQAAGAIRPGGSRPLTCSRDGPDSGRSRHSAPPRPVRARAAGPPGRCGVAERPDRKYRTPGEVLPCAPEAAIAGPEQHRDLLRLQVPDGEIHQRISVPVAVDHVVGGLVEELGDRAGIRAARPREVDGHQHGLRLRSEDVMEAVAIEVGESDGDGPAHAGEDLPDLERPSAGAPEEPDAVLAGARRGELHLSIPVDVGPRQPLHTTSCGRAEPRSEGPVASSPEEADVGRFDVAGGEVEDAVPVQVRADDPGRAHAGGEALPGHERGAPIAEEHGDAVVAGVGDGQVAAPVAVEVSRSRRPWPPSGLVEPRGLERSASSSPEDLQPFLAVERDGEVLVRVAVEVCGYHPARGGAARGARLVERTVPPAGEKRDAGLAALAGNDQIEYAVAIRVDDLRDRRRSPAAGIRRLGEAPVSPSGEDADPAEAPLRDADVLEAVAIEVRGDDGARPLVGQGDLPCDVETERRTDLQPVRQAVGVAVAGLDRLRARLLRAGAVVPGQEG
jgi:hypothetical protein